MVIPMTCGTRRPACVISSLMWMATYCQRNFLWEFV